jgi:hypothetical protein
MKIYRVRPDVNNYQFFVLEDDNLVGTEMLNFDGTPKADRWVVPAVYIYAPKLKKGNFPALWSTTTIVVDQVALKQLRGLLEMSGELLPLAHKDNLYHVLNVTGCFNILDEHHTEWRYEKGSLPIGHYAFHAKRMTETPLFRIPETCGYEILTCEGLTDSEHEFKGRVEQLGLKGLIFEELWNSES